MHHIQRRSRLELLGHPAVTAQQTLAIQHISASHASQHTSVSHRVHRPFDGPLGHQCQGACPKLSPSDSISGDTAPLTVFQHPSEPCHIIVLLSSPACVLHHRLHTSPLHPQYQMHSYGILGWQCLHGRSIVHSLVFHRKLKLAHLQDGAAWQNPPCGSLCLWTSPLCTSKEYHCPVRAMLTPQQAQSRPLIKNLQDPSAAGPVCFLLPHSSPVQATHLLTGKLQLTPLVPHTRKQRQHPPYQ